MDLIQIFSPECFSIFCGLILAVSKSGEVLMPNDLIALGFCSYKSTKFGSRRDKTCLRGIRQSEFQTSKRVSNQSPQLQRLARKLKFHL